jgi:hypothetical protein
MKIKNTKIGKFTKKDAIVASRKASREMEIESSVGWTAIRKAHKSVKDYTRKPKHKKDYSFE